MEASRHEFERIAAAMVDKHGADCLILGCTEVGMLLNEDNVPVEVFDTTKIHCEAAVEMAFCGEQNVSPYSAPSHRPSVPPPPSHSSAAPVITSPASRSIPNASQQLQASASLPRKQADQERREAEMVAATQRAVKERREFEAMLRQRATEGVCYELPKAAASEESHERTEMRHRDARTDATFEVSEDSDS